MKASNEALVVAVVYDTLERAEDALAAAEGIEPIDAVIVVKTSDGRIELRQTREMSVGEGAIAGGTVGLLAGLLIGGPVGGALIGVLAGGGWGARDTGIENDRLRQLGGRLAQSQALLCLLVARAKQPEVVRLLDPYGGEAVEVDAPLP